VFYRLHKTGYFVFVGVLISLPLITSCPHSIRQWCHSDDHLKPLFCAPVVWIGKQGTETNHTEIQPSAESSYVESSSQLSPSAVKGLH